MQTLMGREYKEEKQLTRNSGFCVLPQLGDIIPDFHFWWTGCKESLMPAVQGGERYSYFIYALCALSQTAVLWLHSQFCFTGAVPMGILDVEEMQDLTFWRYRYLFVEI